MAIKIYNLNELPKPQEIVVETFNIGGNWTTNMAGIRLTHTATGIVVECDDTRSPHRNKFIAMQAMKEALLKLSFQSNDENDQHITKGI